MRIDDPESNRRKGPGGPPEIFLPRQGGPKASTQQILRHSTAAGDPCTSSATPAAAGMCVLGSRRKLGARWAVPSPLHTRHDAADGQAAERDGVWQYLRPGIGRHGVAVIVLHVHEALSLRRCVEARLSSHAHAHAGTSHQRWPHSADTKFSTRGRRVTDHTVACTSPLTHCPGYLQALEPSARPVQVFRAQLRCASCMLAQWQQHGAHLEPKLSLRLRCTSAWAVARATAQKCRCIVAVLAGTALAALAALV